MAQQLYANNAQSTLASSITNVQTTITLAGGTGALFPNPSGTQFFLVTLDSGAGVIEIVKCTSRSTDTLTVVRAQENTTGQAFSSGAAAELRITRDTLAGFARYIDRMADTSSTDNLLVTTAMDGNSYLCHNNDDGGTPIMAVDGSGGLWTFPTHQTIICTGSVTASSTTQITSTSIKTLIEASPASGKYLVQFTSGTYLGQVRVITTSTNNVINWTTALAGAPANGSTFTIYQSNYSVINNAGSTDLTPVSVTSSAGVLTIAQNTGSRSVIANGAEAITSITYDNLSTLRRMLVVIRWNTARALTNGTNLLLTNGASKLTSIGDIGFYEITSSDGVTATTREISYASAVSGSAGSGFFNTGIQNGSFSGLTTSSVDTGITIASGHKGILYSLSIANLSPSNMRNVFVELPAAKYLAYSVPIPNSSSVELLRKPKIINNGDLLKLSCLAQVYPLTGHTIAITHGSLTASGTANVVPSTAGDLHGLSDGQYVAVSGATQAGYNLTTRVQTRYFPTSITSVTTTATVTLNNHGLAVGNSFTITGASNSANFNGTFTVLGVTNNNVFTYTIVSAGGVTAQGDIYLTTNSTFQYLVNTGTVSPATGTPVVGDLIASYSYQDIGDTSYQGGCVNVPYTSIAMSTLTSALVNSGANREATMTTSGAHGLNAGDVVLITGVSNANEFNGFQTIVSVPSSTTFTFDVPPLATASGTLTNASLYGVQFTQVFTSATSTLFESIQLSNITGTGPGGTVNPPVTAGNITFSSPTVTVVTTVPHGFKTGDLVTISGTTNTVTINTSTIAPYNGTFVVTVTNSTTFTYVIGAVGVTSPSTGTPIVSGFNEVADASVYVTDTNGFMKYALCQNLQVPQNSTIELIEGPKRLAANDIIKAISRRGGTINVTYAGKQ